MSFDLLTYALAKKDDGTYKEDKHLVNAELVDDSGEVIVVPKSTSIGDISTAIVYATATTAKYFNQCWWITELPSFVPMQGDKINSISFNTNGSGAIQFWGTNQSMPCDNGSNSEDAARADAARFPLFTITTEEGYNTYALDGTDSRVELAEGLTEIICPTSIGLLRNFSVGLAYNNQTCPITYDNTDMTIITGFSQASSNMRAVTATSYQSFAIDFNFDDKESIGGGLSLNMTMNDDTVIKANLENLKPKEIKPLKGKKISIIGDSISSYTGFVPSGYASHYPNVASGITVVEKTWWHPLCTETDMELLTNASWSGSYVCGNATSTTSALAACSSKRVSDIGAKGTPDIIVCYIGINDFGQNVHRQLGDYVGRSVLPEETTEVNVFSDAYAIMIHKLMAAYPSAKIYCCSLLETSSAHWDTGGANTFPTINNNGKTVSEFNERIEELCKNMGARFIDLHSSGINYFNLSAYTHDGLHPNANGAVLIKETVKAKLLNDFAN